ncbi:MAG: hypothetical protein H7829_06420 [Magnetococcus sp. THC-1_WYH]
MWTAHDSEYFFSPHGLIFLYHGIGLDKHVFIRGHGTVGHQIRVIFLQDGCEMVTFQGDEAGVMTMFFYNGTKQHHSKGFGEEKICNDKENAHDWCSL